MSTPSVSPSRSRSRSRSCSPVPKSHRKKGKSKDRARSKSKRSSRESPHAAPLSSTSSNNSPPDSGSSRSSVPGVHSPIAAPIPIPLAMSYQSGAEFPQSSGIADFFSAQSHPPTQPRSSSSPSVPVSSVFSPSSSSSSTSRSVRLVPTSKFPPLSLQADCDSVQVWLLENGFEKEVRDKLLGFTSSDLFALSKSDMKALIGVPAGIRLANRIKLVQEQMETEKSKNNAKSPLSSSSSSSSSVLSPSSRTGRFGRCSECYCSQPATSQCDNENCCSPLCHLHAHKQLFTGFLLCSRCASETVEGRMLAYVGISDQEAAQANKHYYISESAHSGTECNIQ